MFTRFRYVHYEVDKSSIDNETTDIANSTEDLLATNVLQHERTILYPAQWIQCDLRYFDTSILGNSSIFVCILFYF